METEWITVAQGLNQFAALAGLEPRPFYFLRCLLAIPCSSVRNRRACKARLTAFEYLDARCSRREETRSSLDTY